MLSVASSKSHLNLKPREFTVISLRRSPEESSLRVDSIAQQHPQHSDPSWLSVLLSCRSGSFRSRSWDARINSVSCLHATKPKRQEASQGSRPQLICHVIRWKNLPQRPGHWTFLNCLLANRSGVTVTVLRLITNSSPRTRIVFWPVTPCTCTKPKLCYQGGKPQGGSDSYWWKRHRAT